MNAAALIAALVASTNPPRRRAALSTDATTTVAIGAALTLAVLVVAASAATPLIDALDVSAPNLRIGVGLVVAVVGLHDLVFRPPPPGAALDGDRAALVPVFFPVLARPEVVLLALVSGADRGVLFTVAAALVAMAAIVGWHTAAARWPGRAFAVIERGLGAVVAAVQVVLGVALVVDGVFAI